jgi:hypothetical protein
MLSVVQKAGVIAFPDLSALPCFVERLKNALKNNPFVYTSYDDAFERKAGALASLVSAHVNLTAVLNVFLELEEPFEPKQLLECNRYMVPTERDFVLVASHMRNDFCSEIINSIARCCAFMVKEDIKTFKPESKYKKDSGTDARNAKACVKGCPWNNEAYILSSLSQLSFSDGTMDSSDVEAAMKVAGENKWAQYVKLCTVAGVSQNAPEDIVLHRFAAVIVGAQWEETRGMNAGWITNAIRKLRTHNIHDDYGVTGVHVMECLNTPHPAMRIDVKPTGLSGSVASLYVSRCLLNEAVEERNSFRATLELVVQSAANCEAGVYITAEPYAISKSLPRREDETSWTDEQYLAHHARTLPRPMIPFLSASFAVQDHDSGCRKYEGDDAFLFKGRESGCTCFRRGRVGKVNGVDVQNMESSSYVMSQRIEEDIKREIAPEFHQYAFCPEIDTKDYPGAALRAVVRELKTPAQSRNVGADVRSVLEARRKQAREAHQAQKRARSAAMQVD